MAGAERDRSPVRRSGSDLLTNAGVSIATALILLAVAYFDRDLAPSAPH